MRRVALFGVALLLLLACRRTATVSEINVVPEPSSVHQSEGGYTLHRLVRVSMTNLGQNSATMKYVMQSLRRAHLHPTVVSSAEASDLYLVLLDSTDVALGHEGYRLNIQPNGIRLSANTERGLFYAYQSIIQILPPDVIHTNYSAIHLPACQILDTPRFEWRGLHIDASRHFVSVRQMKRFIDIMALYKLNRLHWHLTDDHGWRLPSNAYPKLNSVGSWRPDRGDTPWSDIEPTQPDEVCTYGGFYTVAEIADLVDYAATRGVEIVPGIELPGHCSAALAAYPSLSCDGGEYAVACGPCWPQKSILCAGNDSTLLFVRTVLDELMDVFPGQYIHLGGSETQKDNWEQCQRCQRRMHQLHLRNEEQLNTWLLDQAAQHVAQRGRTAVMWDIADPSAMQRNVVSMTSHNSQPSANAVRNGHKVVACPADYCSFDYYQASPRFQPLAIGGLTTLAKAYQYDPLPRRHTNAMRQMVMGGQCCLWTEYTSTPYDMEYMLLPRLLATAEALWSEPANKEWNHFRHKVEEQKTRLRAKGYAYCDGSFTPLFNAHRIDDTTASVSISTEVPNTYIFYTTDQSDPTRKSSIYIGPVQLRRGTHIKLRPMYKGIERDSVYEYIIK